MSISPQTARDRIGNIIEEAGLIEASVFEQAIGDIRAAQLSRMDLPALMRFIATQPVGCVARVGFLRHLQDTSGLPAAEAIMLIANPSTLAVERMEAAGKLSRAVVETVAHKAVMDETSALIADVNADLYQELLRISSSPADAVCSIREAVHVLELEFADEEAEAEPELAEP